MDKPFEFADFVDEFQVPFYFLDREDGYWNDEGDYVEPAETLVELSGIVLPLSDNDLRYSESGTYSDKDKKIYTVVPLDIDRKIIYKGDEYTIQSFKDYREYSDVFIYLARWREK
ncbi:hypothetical protein ABZ756_02115 [Mammaliicoccus sciuri]